MDLKDFSLQVLEIKSVFESRGQSLGFAESCTGGLLSAALVAHSGVSSFFKGGVISYAGEVKTSLLQVSGDILKTHGEVSLPTAKAMAQGGRSALGVDWCVSVSGIAGPGGGSAEKPVGTVCFALVGPGIERVEKRLFSATTREDIQRQSVIFAFDFLLSAVR